MRSWGVGLSLLAGCGLALATSGIRVVRPGEQVVVRRFGRLLEPAWEPGLHLGLPLGIDRFDRVHTDQVRRLVVGSAEARDDPAAGEFLTGDLNLMRVQAVVQYRIASPGDWLARGAETDALLGRLAGASLTSALARRGIDAALREDRPRIGADVAAHLDSAVQSHRLGIEILAVSLTDARPPAEVAADFSAAQAGESLRNRRVHEARTRAEAEVTAAGAKATAVVDAARAEADRTMLTARAQAKRFGSILGEAGRSRSLTIRRLYLDAMAELLGGVRRSIILAPGDTLDLTVVGLEE
jgi:membrane protease subunit HflK